MTARGQRLTLLLVVVLTAAALGALAWWLERRGGEQASDGPAWPQEVRIGFQTIPNGEAIVRRQGWLEETLTREAGVAVRWVEFASGSDVNAALASGDIDIGLLGSTLFAAGVERGVPYTLIWIHNVIGDNEALVARASAGIGTTADLAGKAVATPFGSTTHYTLLAALQAAGLSTRNVTLLDMKPQDIAAAWARGDIDAAYVWEPTLSLLLESGGHVLVSSADLVERGVVTADLGVVRTDFLQRYPHVVEAYLRAQMRAVEMIRADLPAAAGIVGDLFDLPADEVADQMQKLVFLDGCAQAGSGWLGRDMAAVIADTARFLHDQGLLATVPSDDAIQAAIDAGPLAVVAGMCRSDG